jgi:hypothetical protein
VAHSLGSGFGGWGFGPTVAEALHTWRRYTRYRAADDWVFASPAVRGQKPYWGQCLMRTIIRPAATKVGITQHIGWHTFRHTYSSLLRANRTDIKVTQELLRHASSGSRWIHIPKPSQFRSGERRAASFVFSRSPQRLLVETGLLGGVPNLCLLEMARSVRKYCRFNEMHSR